ncbi:MAG TPA: YIP1 family protein [Bryobacteraceae bacterium]|nr:YIP1 family protein [Bryobacteraceae bacterium]
MKALLEVFYQPVKVFTELPGRSYAWVAPLILDMILIMLSTWSVPHYMGRENIARQQMEMFARNMSPEQMQQAIARSTSQSQIIMSFVGAAIFTVVILLVIAGALMAFGMMTSGSPRFGTMFSMVSLAFFPYWLITVLMTVLVLMTAPDPASMDWRNLLATNVGAFMNKNETSKGLYSLMGSIDILSFAEICLLALGFSKVTKAKFGFGLAAVLLIWAMYVLGKMGLSVVFG